ncbi:MAG: rRNA pseudouridine synthase, partial [Anaerotignum sp.]|nr:rRNA pseudouridine synthase [Anaerotignum sp.]
DLVKGVNERIFPVGRLDYDTSGLLLLTNDGDLTYKLTHPKHDVDKTYIAKLYGIPDEDALQKFRRGVTIDGVRTKPAKIQIIEKDKDGRFCTAEIIIHEGRNRQVRKMCEAIKHPVAQLQRVATGDLKLGNLEKGKYRHLTEKEVKYLKKL